MNAKRLGIAALVLFALAQAAFPQGITIRGLGGGRRNEIERVKNIHGVVEDLRGKPIAGARVQIRNVKDNTIRTATTDEKGSYAMKGLPPDVDYEIRADFKGVVSERQFVSSFLNREDNLVNFKLELAIVADSTAEADAGPELQTYDLVQLKASFEMPQGVPAPIPAALLLHGYGENRGVWEGFRTQLLARGWAVMSLDLRGHGDSKTKNRRPIEASPDWRTSPREFTQDVDPALDWLKKQPRLDSRRIVVIGYDVGANLALIASGKFTEVRTVVAVKPVAREALEMAGSAQDFNPRSALVVTSDASAAEPIKAYASEPFRMLTIPLDGGVAEAFQSTPLTDAIFQWIKETY